MSEPEKSPTRKKKKVAKKGKKSKSKESGEALKIVAEKGGKKLKAKTDEKATESSVKKPKTDEVESVPSVDSTVPTESKGETSENQTSETSETGETEKSGEEKLPHRGIPPAVFIEDVGKLIETDLKKADRTLQDLHILKSKYSIMEVSLLQQKKGLLEKIPDIENALQSLSYLIKKHEKKKKISANFMLADNVYAKANIKPRDTVFLWLGANVMMEYKYLEAQTLLTTNLGNSKRNLTAVNGDLEFLKEQITITDVNIARVHNHRVELRRIEKEKLAKKSKS